MKTDLRVEDQWYMNQSDVDAASTNVHEDTHTLHYSKQQANVKDSIWQSWSRIYRQDVQIKEKAYMSIQYKQFQQL